MDGVKPMVMDGHTAEARAGFTGAFAELRRLQQLQDLVRWEVEAISLLPDAPEAAAWAAEVSELGERVGAVPLLTRLAEVRPGSTARATPSAERSEEPVPGPS